VETPCALAVWRELFLDLYDLPDPVLPLGQVMHWPGPSGIARPALDGEPTLVFGGFFYNFSTPPPAAEEIDERLEEARARGIGQLLVPTVRETADAGALAEREFVAVPAFVECVFELEAGVDADLRARVGRRRHREVLRLVARAEERYAVEYYDAARLRTEANVLELAATLHDFNRRKYGHRLNLYAEPILRRLLDSALGDHLLIAVRSERASGTPVQASIALIDRSRAQLYLLVHGIRHDLVPSAVNLDIADTYQYYRLAEREGVTEVNLGRGSPEYKRNLGAHRLHLLENWVRTGAPDAQRELAAAARMASERLGGWSTGLVRSRAGTPNRGIDGEVSSPEDSVAVHQREFEEHRRSIRLDAGDVSYVDVGNGPVAVFVHGVFTSAYLWRRAIDALRDERRCIAIDLPAHGRTEVDDDHPVGLGAQAELLERFCEECSLGTVDLVANDTGGAIAQILASRYPERLRTLTLTNCDVDEQVPPDAFKPIADAARAGQLAPIMRQFAADPAGARTAAFVQCYERPEEVPEETMRAFVGRFADLGPARQIERVIVAMDAAEVIEAERRLGEIDVPTLIVWGTGDVFFDKKWAHWLKDAIRGANEVVEIPDAKLFFPDERPADLVPHIRRHWRAHAPAPADA
jgi:pimeloyl-ACP methyl ester carboxylesterase